MSTLTSSLLRQVLDYNRETGTFTWRAPDVFHPRLKGKQAGCLKAGYRQIEIAGKVYRASHLAWLYVYRQLPDRSLLHINGNSADDSIFNLKLRGGAV